MAKWQVKATRPHSASGTKSSRTRPDTGSATVSKSGFHMLRSPIMSRDIEDHPRQEESTLGMFWARKSQKSGEHELERCNSRKKKPHEKQARSRA